MDLPGEEMTDSPPIIKVNETPNGYEVQIVGQKQWWFDEIREYFLAYGLLHTDGDLDKHIKSEIRFHLVNFITKVSEKYQK